MHEILLKDVTDALNLISFLFFFLFLFADFLACAANHIRLREDEEEEGEEENCSVSNSFMILAHLNWILVFARNLRNSMQKYALVDVFVFKM